MKTRWQGRQEENNNNMQFDPSLEPGNYYFESLGRYINSH